jgi:hypothetical protein
LVDPPGPASNGIIAVLIGLLGQPLPGQTLSLVDGTSNTLMTVSTNARGEFILPNLSPGSYGLVGDWNGDGLDTVGYLIDVWEHAYGLYADWERLP